MARGAGCGAVDEAARAGRQICLRPPDGFTRSLRSLYGSRAGRARARHQLFDRMLAEGRLCHLPGISLTRQKRPENMLPYSPAPGAYVLHALPNYLAFFGIGIIIRDQVSSSEKIRLPCIWTV